MCMGFSSLHMLFTELFEKSCFLPSLHTNYHGPAKLIKHYSSICSIYLFLNEEINTFRYRSQLVRRAPSIVGIYSMTHSFERVLFTWPAVSMCAFSGAALLSCRQHLPADFFN